MTEHRSSSRSQHSQRHSGRSVAPSADDRDGKLPRTRRHRATRPRSSASRHGVLRWVVAGAWLLAIAYYFIESHYESAREKVRGVEVRDYAAADAADTAVREFLKRERSASLPTDNLSALVEVLAGAKLLSSLDASYLRENEARFRLQVVDNIPRVTPEGLIRARANTQSASQAKE